MGFLRKSGFLDFLDFFPILFSFFWTNVFWPYVEVEDPPINRMLGHFFHLKFVPDLCEQCGLKNGWVGQ